MSPGAEPADPPDWEAFLGRVVRLKDVLDAVPARDPADRTAGPVVLHVAPGFSLATLAGRRWLRGARLADAVTDVTAVVRTDALLLVDASGTVEVPLEGLKVGSDLVEGRRNAIVQVPGHRPRLLMGGGLRYNGASLSDLELLLVASTTIWARARRDGTSTAPADSLWAIVHRQAVRVARPG